MHTMMPDRLESNTRTVTLLTACSRLTGLARDAVLSRLFGVSELMSDFWIAFLVPNLFRRLFGEGALGASYLPVYTKLNKSNPDQAGQLASLLLAGLRGGGAVMDAATLEHAQIEGGPMAAARAAAELLARAFTVQA